MEMSEFINNSDTRGAVSKIITWVEEPKSGDIRTAAKSVIVSMFNLNPPEFSALITGLQKTFQVRVTSILYDKYFDCVVGCSGLLIAFFTTLLRLVIINVIMCFNTLYFCL